MKYLIDTSALMQHHCYSYLENNLFSKGKKLIVPNMVRTELEHHANGEDKETANHAKKGIEFLDSHKKQILPPPPITNLMNIPNADAEIISICQQLCSEDDVAIFVHDHKLSLDLLPISSTTANTAVIIISPDKDDREKVHSYIQTKGSREEIKKSLANLAKEYNILLDSHSIVSPFFRDCFLWQDMAATLKEQQSQLFIFEGSLSLIRKKEDDYNKAAYQLAQEFISTGLLEILPGDFLSEEDYLNGILPFHHIGTKKLLLLTSRLQSSHYTTMHPKSVKGAPSYDLAILHHGGGIQMMREGATLPAPPKQQKQDSTKATVAPDKETPLTDKVSQKAPNPPSTIKNPARNYQQKNIEEAINANNKENVKIAFSQGGNPAWAIIKAVEINNANILNWILTHTKNKELKVYSEAYNFLIDKIIKSDIKAGDMRQQCNRTLQVIDLIMDKEEIEKTTGATEKIKELLQKRNVQALTPKNRELLNKIVEEMKKKA